MSIASFISALPELTVTAIGLAVIVATIILYALFKKGDVSAEFSHGSTTFRLSAKDRLNAGPSARQQSL